MTGKGKETVGQRLQRLRQEAGLSQFELAKTADIPIGTIRNWEQGIRSPRLDTAAKVAVALGISLDVIADIEPKKKPRKGKEE